MKPLLAAIGFTTALLFSSVSSAENAEQLQQFTAKLVEQLQLNDVQASQVAVLNQNTLDQLRVLKSKGETNRRSQMSALRDIGEERKQAMRDILDDHQYQRYQETSAERRAELKKYFKEQRNK